MKILNADGSLKQEAFAPLFGDFEDMYLDFNRFISVGAILMLAVDRWLLIPAAWMGMCMRCSSHSRNDRTSKIPRLSYGDSTSGNISFVISCISFLTLCTSSLFDIYNT